MTAEDYKAALAALELDHETAARLLDIGVRTSYRYAAEGAPPKIKTMLGYMLADKRTSRRRKRA